MCPELVSNTGAQVAFGSLNPQKAETSSSQETGTCGKPASRSVTELVAADTLGSHFHLDRSRTELHSTLAPVPKCSRQVHTNPSLARLGLRECPLGIPQQVCEEA